MTDSTVLGGIESSLRLHFVRGHVVPPTAAAPAPAARGPPENPWTRATRRHGAADKNEKEGCEKGEESAEEEERDPEADLGPSKNGQEWDVPQELVEEYSAMVDCLLQGRDLPEGRAATVRFHIGQMVKFFLNSLQFLSFRLPRHDSWRFDFRASSSSASAPSYLRVIRCLNPRQWVASWHERRSWWR